MKIALVSDTHLAPRARAFDANWLAARDWIEATAPDRVVHLGDISADGSSNPGELAFAAQRLAGLGCELHALPGNHDVGDNRSIAGADRIDDRRQAFYRAVFGPDHWMLAVGRWRLIGLNAQLFGSDSDAETAQAVWLKARLHEASGAPLCLFLHKPLFRDRPDDDDANQRYLPAHARTRLLRCLRSSQLRLVVSGHVHQARLHRVDDVDHLWVPSTSFCIPDTMQETIGRKIVGVALLSLDDSGHAIEVLTPPGMLCHNLLDQVEVYPQLAAIKPAPDNADTRAGAR